MLSENLNMFSLNLHVILYVKNETCEMRLKSCLTVNRVLLFQEYDILRDQCFRRLLYC